MEHDWLEDLGVTISNQAAGLRPGVCTSSTRPVTPYDGQVIYETDTDRCLVWNNSAWVQLSTGTVNPPAMESITPTSVSGTGVSLSGSTVIFTAATTAFINGIFTAQYRNYCCIWDTTTNTGGGLLRWRPSQNGSVAAGAITSVGSDASVSAGTGSLNAIGGQQAVTYGLLGAFGAASSIGGGRFEILQPAIATPTQILFHSGCYSTNSANNSVTGASLYYTAASHDGLEVTTSTTNWTGNMRFYGYR